MTTCRRNTPGIWGSAPTGVSVWIQCLFLLLGVAGLMCTAQAQVLGWGGLEASLELGYEQDRQDTSQKNAADSNFDSDRFRERLRLRGRRMYLLDPRLAIINLSAGIELFQENNDFTGQNASQHGRLHDYSIDSTFFSEKPYSLVLYANQTENRVSRNFGTRTSVRSNTKGARITLNEQSVLKDMGFPFFSTSLEVNQLKIHEDSSGSGQDFHRDEQHDLLQYRAHKGFLTADLTFRYRYEDVQDSLRQDNGFKTQTANLDYGLDFGPTLNWRWTSNNNYTRRSGTSGNDILTVNQNLLIHHNVDLFSDYRYNFFRFNSDAGTTTAHNADFSISQRVYNNLNANLNAQANLTDLPEGTTKSYGGGPGFNYRRPVFAHGHLILNASGNYLINDNNLASSTIKAHNEAHQVSADFPVGNPGFLLDNLLVVNTSINIIDRRDGGQLTTTAGIDYEVITEGDHTRIRPLPTSVILRANDPLEVSYTYQVEPSIRFATTRLDLGGSLDFGWLMFSAARSVSNQRVLTGIDNGLLQDRTTDTADVRVRGEWRRMQLGADARYQREDTTDQNYSTWRFSQSISYPGFHGFTLTANTVESFTNYKQPSNRSSEDYSANIELNGMLARVWQTRIYAGLLIFNDSEIQNQTTARAGLNIKRNLGKLTFSGSLLWNKFDRGFTDTTDRRIEVNAIRRF